MAGPRGGLGSVAEARRRARRRLPAAVFQAIEAGSEAGVTRADNLRAFDELSLAPPPAAGPRAPASPAPVLPAPASLAPVLPERRDLRTRVLGTDIALPVIASPAGVQAIDPLGEAGIAIGTARAGTAMGLSEFASRPIAEVIPHNPDIFFQVHWSAAPEDLYSRSKRAGRAGAKALIVTLDWCFPGGRDWGSPWIPERMDAAAMLRYLPGAMTRPGYVARWLRAGGPPSLTVPNMAADGRPAPSFFGAYRAWREVHPPTWEDVAWLRERWDGPFCVKGIIRPDDARRAVDIGATAVSVSNHGGNNLDGTPASIRALPAIVAAVGDRAEVLLDGGIRRGGDVVKALALGARAVMIGRPVLWGLAAGGPAGVADVFEILRSGIDSALASLGRASVRDLEPGDVLVPRGFTVE